MPADRRFGFRFDPRFAPLLAWFGIRPERAEVRIGRETLQIRFGPWRVRTPLANVQEARLTGPLRWWKAVGVRLSLADRGLTFGSGTAGGVCIRLREPVRGPAPFALLRHPGITVTLDRPRALARALRYRRFMAALAGR